MQLDAPDASGELQPWVTMRPAAGVCIAETLPKWVVGVSSPIDRGPICHPQRLHLAYPLRICMMTAEFQHDLWRNIRVPNVPTWIDGDHPLVRPV